MVENQRVEDFQGVDGWVWAFTVNYDDSGTTHLFLAASEVVLIQLP